MNTLSLMHKDGVENIEYNQTIVFIGSNGSGKSRLGAWIEESESNPKTVHRISAQKNISFNEDIPMRSLSTSRLLFETGYDFKNDPDSSKKYYNDPDFFKKNINYYNIFKANRWRNKFTTGLLDDYEYTLSMLFSEQNKRDENIAKKLKGATGTIKAEDYKIASNIDKLVQIWNKLLPHRQIEFSDQKIIVKKDGINYSGTELSDGERVIIYLMGQVLSVEPNTILIVDEPEIHLHKSIINKLWDELEKLRSDISILYITHDLDFARERYRSKAIWVKSYDGNNNWDWEEIDLQDDVKFDQIYFEIAGLRKSVLFVEGKKGSLDYKFYGKIYSNNTVIPVGSCNTVIEMVKSYNKEVGLNNIAAQGIVDRDFRNDSEIKYLDGKGIKVLEIQEIENIFCLPIVAKWLYEYLCPHLSFKKGLKEILTDLENIIIKEFESNFEKIVFNTTHRIIRNNLSKFPKPLLNEDFEVKFQEHVKNIDIKFIIKEIKDRLDGVKNSKSVNEMLKFMDNKGLSSNIAKLFEMSKEKYEETVLMHLDNDDFKKIFEALLPKLS